MTAGVAEFATGDSHDPPSKVTGKFLHTSAGALEASGICAYRRGA